MDKIKAQKIYDEFQLYQMLFFVVSFVGSVMLFGMGIMWAPLLTIPMIIMFLLDIDEYFVHKFFTDKDGNILVNTGGCWLG